MTSDEEEEDEVEEKKSKLEMAEEAFSLMGYKLAAKLGAK